MPANPAMLWPIRCALEAIGAAAAAEAYYRAVLYCPGATDSELANAKARMDDARARLESRIDRSGMDAMWALEEAAAAMTDAVEAMPGEPDGIPADSPAGREDARIL